MRKCRIAMLLKNAVAAHRLAPPLPCPPPTSCLFTLLWRSYQSADAPCLRKRPTPLEERITLPEPAAPVGLLLFHA